MSELGQLSSPLVTGLKNSDPVGIQNMAVVPPHPPHPLQDNALTLDTVKCRKAQRFRSPECSEREEVASTYFIRSKATLARIKN